MFTLHSPKHYHHQKCVNFRIRSITLSAEPPGKPKFDPELWKSMENRT